MDNFTNLIIPTPEEYHKEFIEKHKNLSTEAFKEASRHIKPIADYVSDRRLKQPSAGSMDSHIRFDGRSNKGAWDNSFGEASYYENGPVILGSTYTCKGITEAAVWDRYGEKVYIGKFPTLREAQLAVERARHGK